MSQYAELIERLRAGARYLPRMATEGSKEAIDFDNAGDGILVNEGDFWLLLMDARQAADALSLIEAERDKLDGFAQHWHGEIEAIGVLLGIGAPDAGEVPKAVQALVAERDKLREALSSLLVSTKFELSGSTKRHRTSSDVVAWANLIAKSEAALHPTDNDHGGVRIDAPTGEEELAWEAYVAQFSDSERKPTSREFGPWLKHRRLSRHDRSGE